MSLSREPYAVKAARTVLTGGLGKRAVRQRTLILPTYVAPAVRRESGMEECGNTSGIQVPDEPLELSVVDHSTR